MAGFNNGILNVNDQYNSILNIGLGDQVVNFSGNRTLSSSDNFKTLVSSTANATITIPTGLPSTFTCRLLNSAAGAMLISPAVGVTYASNILFTPGTSGKLTRVSPSLEIYSLDGGTATFDSASSNYSPVTQLGQNSFYAEYLRFSLDTTSNEILTAFTRTVPAGKSGIAEVNYNAKRIGDFAQAAMGRFFYGYASSTTSIIEIANNIDSAGYNNITGAGAAPMCTPSVTGTNTFQVTITGKLGVPVRWFVNTVIQEVTG
jgi:hypothetical protein